jgi:glycosyltransferase involved in cell wall biosynthesis
MKILFLNYEYPPLGGGAGNATEALMREFSLMPALEVDVVTSSVDAAYHCETLGENALIRIHRLPIGKNAENLTYQSAKDILVYSWKAFWFSRKLLAQAKYDGIHAFFTVPSGFLAMILGWWFGVPYIVSLRGSDVPGYSLRFRRLYPFLKALVVAIWHRAAAVIANSRGLRELARESDPKQAIGVIYNGIDTELFCPGRSDLRDDRTFTILCASRLSRRKGFRYAIEAFALLTPRYPETRLLIAGGVGDA